MVSKALVVAAYRDKLRALASAGVELVVVIPRYWREAGTDIAFESGDDRLYDTVLTRVAWNGHFHVHYYPSLPRIIRHVRPAILHMDEEPYNLATFLGFREAKAASAGTLFFTWQNLDKRYPPPFSWFERYVFNHADYAIAGTQTAEDLLRRRGFKQPTTVIPQFGVDIDRFRPGKPPAGEFTVGFLGRLVPEKGLFDLISAFRRLPESSRLVLTGDGPLHATIQQKCADLLSSGRLEMRQRLTSTDVPDLLRTLHVLVLPSHTTSKWQEQYGRILVEAMATGIPVVGSNSGEIPNVVGDAGMIFPEGDVERLASDLRLLSSDRARWQSCREAGRQRAVEFFSQGAIAQKTAEAYHAILSNGPKANEPGL